MKSKTKRKLKKGTKIVTKIFEATGLPHGFSATMAWFAERLVLAALTLAVLSFAFGVIFVQKLAEPIGQSKVYDRAAQKAHVLTEQIIDFASPVFTALLKDNRDPDELTPKKIAERKEILRNYLAGYGSPFAEDDEALEAFASSKNMKLMVAISFVESTFGKRCYYYNCSGIGGYPPNLRKYNSYAEWIHDFDDLLERRYKDVPIEGFLGLYVQPGSPNWLYGVKQVLQELEELGLS